MMMNSSFDEEANTAFRLAKAHYDAKGLVWDDRPLTTARLIERHLGRRGAGCGEGKNYGTCSGKKL
jgi:hypothetical protein